jgi:hypothetical protein
VETNPYLPGQTDQRVPPHPGSRPVTREDEAERLLQSLVEAHTDVRWPALYLLAIHAHRTADPISGSILTANLLDQGFPASDAERFGTEFDRYRELLTLYDRLKA